MKVTILSSKMRLKKPIGNIHFGKMILSLMLAGVMLLGNVNSVIATDSTKTLTVTIGEGALDQSSLSKMVTIPNLKSTKVKSVSNGGSATLSISGNNVTVNVGGGTPTRTVNNPAKYSKTVTDSLTNSTNSFPTTKAYSLDGYTTNMAKDGGSRVTSGVYMPAESKEVTNQVSANYDVGGFKGTLNKYLYSGEFTPGYSEEVSEVVELGTWSGGYQHYADQEISKQENRVPRIYQQLWKTYPESYVTVVWGKRTYTNTVPDRDTRVYKYKGTVTKPASDTRVWQQDYKGTAYKAGTDNYYSYDVTIEYIDNSDPDLEITLPSENSYFSKINMV